jgi:hypothetical protein
MMLTVIVTALLGIIALAIILRLISYPIIFSIWLLKFTYNFYKSMFGFIASRKKKKTDTSDDEGEPSKKGNQRDIEFSFELPFKTRDGQDEMRAHLTFKLNIINDAVFIKTDGTQSLEDVFVEKFGRVIHDLMVSISNKKAFSRYIGSNIISLVSDISTKIFIQGIKTTFGVELCEILLEKVESGESSLLIES